jgi:hypothetical protein
VTVGVGPGVSVGTVEGVGGRAVAEAVADGGEVRVAGSGGAAVSVAATPVWSTDAGGADACRLQAAAPITNRNIAARRVMG